jgi:hypothetical protein
MGSWGQMYSTLAVGDLQQGGTDGITYFVLLLLLVDYQLHKADPLDPLQHQWHVDPLHYSIKHIDFAKLESWHIAQ